MVKVKSEKRNRSLSISENPSLGWDFLLNVV